MDNNAAFNAAYRLHLDPQVRAVFDEPDVNKSLTMALALAAKGFAIDGPIVVNKLDPWKVMNMRLDISMPWEAPLGAPQPIISPGPGEVATDFSQPAPKGSIINSIDIADYPPVDPAPPISNTPPPSSYVGKGPNGFGTYVSIDGDPLLALPIDEAEGKQVSDPRGTFVYHRNPWGGYYTKL